jgi:hypothetical protein
MAAALWKVVWPLMLTSACVLAFSPRSSSKVLQNIIPLFVPISSEGVERIDVTVVTTSGSSKTPLQLQRTKDTLEYPQTRSVATFSTGYEHKAFRPFPDLHLQTCAPSLGESAGESEDSNRLFSSLCKARQELEVWFSL